MRNSLRTTRHRGLTLLELMLALAITVMVAGAIAGMMAAVSAGVSGRRDGRSIMVRANAAQARLSGYVIPARAVLDATASDVAIWLIDSRQSDSVHASEIRWIASDVAAGALDVRFVDFPDNWTDTQKDLADLEYPAGSDWFSILAAYETQGLIQSIRLVDGLDSVAISTEGSPLDSRIVGFNLAFSSDANPVTVRCAPSVRIHRPPLY